MSDTLRHGESRVAKEFLDAERGTMPGHDKWSRWLLETRFGGDERLAGVGRGFLTKVRDRLLEKSVPWKARSCST